MERTIQIEKDGQMEKRESEGGRKGGRERMNH